MTTAATTVEEAIRLVARGERPWTDLQSFGMELQPQAGRADRLPATDARLTAQDLARGFVSCQGDPTALREWAFVMEAIDADFEAVEAHPDGEVVLGALRNASFGDPVNETDVEVIRALALEGDT